MLIRKPMAVTETCRPWAVRDARCESTCCPFQERANYDLSVKGISGEENKNHCPNIIQKPWSSSKMRLVMYYLQMKCLLRTTYAYDYKTLEDYVNRGRNWIVLQCGQGVYKWGKLHLLPEGAWDTRNSRARATDAGPCVTYVGGLS